MPPLAYSPVCLLAVRPREYDPGAEQKGNRNGKRGTKDYQS
jgi:hypothetical protein